VPTLDDDRGHPVHLAGHPTRIVSLVPSLTEALAVTVPDRLVGATDWCTHTAGLEVPRVRGTKNPDHAEIGRLKPDLVVANQEENRRIDVERLRQAGLPVWVTVVESLDEGLRSLRRLLVDVVGTAEPDWLVTATAEWDRPVELPPARVVVPVWRDPWMVVGSRTFSGDLLTRLGLTHLLATAEDRYPSREISEMADLRPDLVLLPDEPYPFGPDDGPEAFPGLPTALVSGRDLTWYGPSLATARADLTKAVRSAVAAG
jgi:ABC-type Fe3+-hydroxamate transport system substrate-binding protein